MPKVFNSVSQEERETLDLEEDGVHVQSGNRFNTKYIYLSPKTKQIILGSVGVLLLFIAFMSISGGGSGSWPPTEITQDFYSDSKLNKKHSPVSLQLGLKAGSSFMQKTKMTTKTSVDFGATNFAETVSMNTENSVTVNSWKDASGINGFSVGVTFTHVDVSTQDSSGEFTYYNSLAESGDTDFDAVLLTMIGDSATIEIDSDYNMVDEQDLDNALEQMEQEYSLGTTTGLSAIDQVYQVINMKSYLPQSKSEQYSVGDSWDIEFETDVYFSGLSTLKGFVKYMGADCAVIQSEANVDGEENFLYMDDDADPMVSVVDGNIQFIVLFDFKRQIPRYTKTVITMNTKVGGEEDTNTTGLDDAVTMPMIETVEMYFVPK